MARRHVAVGHGADRQALLHVKDACRYLRLAARDVRYAQRPSGRGHNLQWAHRPTVSCFGAEDMATKPAFQFCKPESCLDMLCAEALANFRCNSIGYLLLRCTSRCIII
jgi:hypothetical protein